MSLFSVEAQPEVISVVNQQLDKIETFYILKSIAFEGNKKTKADYLQKELNLIIGEKYTYEELEREVMRLQRLNGLYDSELEYTIDQFGELDLKVLVREQRTLLPVINFGLQADNRWFQIGLVDNNLRGRGDELYAFYQNNVGRHVGQLYYKNNHVLSSKWGYHINALRWHSLEPLNFGNRRLQYEYKNNLLSVGAHYRASGKHMFEYSSAIFNEIYQKSNLSQDQSIGPDQLDLDKVLNKFEYNMDLLKYDQIYLEGSRLTTRYQAVLTLQNMDMFNVYELEYKYFLRTSKKTNLAVRGMFGISNNNASPFSPFVLDSYKNIRGVGDRVIRGTALLTANAEWRYTVRNRKKWAAQAIAFIDAGVIRTSGSDTQDIFSAENRRESFGIGARLHYKKIYNAVLRVDYGFEIESKKGNFVVGLGQYF